MVSNLSWPTPRGNHGSGRPLRSTRHGPRSVSLAPRMSALRVENVRGGLVESAHRVAVAVVEPDGRMVARAGDPALASFLRSAAKPFQAVPLVEDGVVSHFAVTERELALACASHNSEPMHVELATEFLHRLGCVEDDLACGPHPPLSRDLSIRDPMGEGQRPVPAVSRSRLASNCSGKHIGMLALAKHHGWDLRGYHEPHHPVQRRVKREVARWIDMPVEAIGEGVDGCGVVAFSMPIVRMALGAARLSERSDASGRAVIDAMMRHPDLVAGTGRLCTAVMSAYPGAVMAKVGAEGVYLVALVERRLGVALKVEDGSGRAAIVALVAVLGDLGLEPHPAETLGAFAQLTLRNTRGEVVGTMRPAGRLEFV